LTEAPIRLNLDYYNSLTIHENIHPMGVNYYPVNKFQVERIVVFVDSIRIWLRYVAVNETSEVTILCFERHVLLWTV
jgi:hypothetical protein